MVREYQQRSVIDYLRAAVYTLFSYPIVFYPFLITTFIQLFLLEILYFSPRFPLSVFFAPLIKKLYGEIYLHYPFNFTLLPKLFQHVHSFLHIFINSFFIGVSIVMLNSINNDKRASLRNAVKQVLPQYVHLVIAAMIMYGIFSGLTYLNHLALLRATQIGSSAGLFYIIKKFVLLTGPYFNLFFGVLVTALFAFVYTIIVVERKKVASAIIQNFKLMSRSFIFIFMLVLLPTLLYLPILMLRDQVVIIAGDITPAIQGWLIVVSIIVLAWVDAIVYTVVTSYYFLRQEDR